MKVKEKDWGPAIESFFGSKSLRSFCVHSNRDYKVLENIFEKLNLPKKQRPSVTISKFFSQVSNDQIFTLIYIKLLIIKIKTVRQNLCARGIAVLVCHEL